MARHESPEPPESQHQQADTAPASAGDERDHRAPFGDESASWVDDGKTAVGIPDRYDLRHHEEGTVLVCREAPGMTVRIDRRYAFSEAEARKLPARSILLDGAGAFAPLVDDGALLFNLDHHQGCSRAFTLSTCEQALILVFKGLDLDQGEWTLYANEPDLDTVMAIWILLNHRRLRAMSSEARDRIVPLIRLEGAIDANGFEIAELCGLPSDIFEAQKARLDQLHGLELDAKKSGVWNRSDLLEYSADMLRSMDRMVYVDADFEDFARVDQEYAHVEIGAGKVAVVCRDGGGIYDVEKRLRKVWGDRLGLIALEKESGHYTLRRSASLAGIELETAYRKLNLLDPVVDGRPPGKCWGGSDEIGGSPRPDGTGLSPLEIAKILKQTYRRLTPWQRARPMLQAALCLPVLGLAAWVGVFVMRYFATSSATPEGRALEMVTAGLLIAVGAWLINHQVSRGWLWIYGWRRPAPDGKALASVPVVLGAVALGGAWLPVEADGAGIGWALGAVWAWVLAGELCFRGLIHGLLILDHPVQEPGDPWRLSVPNLFAALLQVVTTVALVSVVPVQPLLVLTDPVWTPWVVGGAAGLLGLCLGAVRERTVSLWPGVLLLGVAQTLAVVVGLRLGAG